MEGGGPLEPGLYLLDSSSPRLDPTNTYGRRHLLVVTELNLTLKAGQREALVWATRLDSGQPAAGLTVTFFEDGGNRLGEAVTDKDGLARLDLGQRTNRATVQAVVLPNSGQSFSAVSENWARGVSPYDFGWSTLTLCPATPPTSTPTGASTGPAKPSTSKAFFAPRMT